jgi:hypothetical protein
MQTALLDLKALLADGVTLLNVQPADIAAVSRNIYERIFGFFQKISF